MRTYRFLFCLLFVASMSVGCSSSQGVKNTWKGTKNIWYTYVNRAAAIDYDDTGKMPEYETRFSKAMMGVDTQLHALERAMQNADKPPTPEWLNAFFAQFPWVDGIIGLNGEGGVVGQAGRERSDLDFNILLESDPKQNLRALRGNVQLTDSDAECMLGVPLYDGVDFLGVVIAYFDMRSLMRYSEAPEALAVTSPAGSLWAGSETGGVPLDGENWAAIVRSKSSGTISSGSGTYIWITRFLGNYPLVFAALKTAPSGADAEKATNEEVTEPLSPSGESLPAASQAPDSTSLSEDLKPKIEPLPEL